MWQTPVRCHLTAWLNPLIIHLFFCCWEWRWEVPLVHPDFVVTLNYPTVSIHTGVGITWEENAPNKTDLKDLLSVKWISAALSSAQCNQNPAGGLSSPTLSHSSVLPTLFLYLKDSFIPKGKVDYTIPSRLNSLYLPFHHLPFLNYPILLEWLFTGTLTDGISACFPSELLLISEFLPWYYFSFSSHCWVLPTFVGSVSVWGSSFSFWELNSGLQNSTCKLESLTLKKKPRNNKTSPKAQAQDSEWKYSLIFIINAGSALCVLYFTLTQPDL